MSHLEHSSTIKSIDVKPTIALLTENKPSVASLPNDLVEKKPEISSQMLADDSVKKLDYYLAKVDISIDIVHSELYKQCMSISKMKESKGIRDAKEVELKVINHMLITMVFNCVGKILHFCLIHWSKMHYYKFYALF